MKFRYWLTVYPFQLQGGQQFAPTPTTWPTEAPEGAKVITFDVEVPDDIFGAIAVPATVNGTDDILERSK